MPVNRLQSHHIAPDTSRASSGRAFVAFDVPLPRAGAKPPEIVRALLHHIGMTDADIARFSQQNGYDPIEHSMTAMQKYGGFHTASVHVTREHPQGVARLDIPRADYDALRHFINGFDHERHAKQHCKVCARAVKPTPHIAASTWRHKCAPNLTPNCPSVKQLRRKSL